MLFEVIMNIKMFVLKDLVNFAAVSALGDGKIVIFVPQVVTHTRAKFLSGSQEFYKNGDKFGWVKYWQTTCNLPKFSLTTILHYTSYSGGYM